MLETFLNTGKKMVEIGLAVGFILGGLVAIIVTAAFVSGKARRYWNER
jgi:hypothetical protein